MNIPMGRKQRDGGRRSRRRRRMRRKKKKRKVASVEVAPMEVRDGTKI